MLVVPDVHGREFWKEPLQRYPDDEVIFLGDYLDPYSDEGITHEKAFEVFSEILSLRRDVTYLLGNHDLGYLGMKNLPRQDLERYWEIQKLFKENIDLFKVAVSRDDYVFSHSGIHPLWLSYHPEFGEGIKSSVENLNLKLWEPSTMMALSERSRYRGDWGRSIGSPVWSDLREWIEGRNDWEGVIQVFGHTQLKDGIIIDKGHFKCIDCRHVIRIVDNKLEVL